MRKNHLAKYGLVFLVLAMFVAPPVRAQTSWGWRTFDSVMVGSSSLRVESSPQRHIRIVVRNGGQELVSPDVEFAALRRWAESVQVGMALGSRGPFEFENTVALLPARKGDSVGYALTVADSVGTTSTLFATLVEARSFVATLEHLGGRLAAAAEQNTSIPMPSSDANVIRCEHIRDSVVTNVAPPAWPRSALADRPGRLRYPRAPSDAPPGEPIVAAIVMLPIGFLDSTYFDVSGTDDANYKSRALEWMSRVKWTPAVVDGCPVVSKTSLITVSVGVSRRR